MYYQETGNQQAALILFLHGGGVSGWMWRKQVEHFKHFHCIVPDLPEQGLSLEHDQFSISSSAKKLLTLIEEKAMNKKVIVVGFSLGAQIAIEMVSMRPDLIAAAMINSALVRPLPFARKLIKPSIALMLPLTKVKAFARLQAKEIYISQEDFEKYYNESSRMKRETLTRILEENMAFSIPEQFNRASCSMLVTVGAKEKTIMKQSALDLVNSNSNCTGVALPNVGHGISLAQPEAFNYMLEAWILNGTAPEGKRIIPSY